MALTWDVTKVENYNENFPSVFRTDPPTEIWNQDGTEVVQTIEHEERECWHPVTEVLVWSLIGIGMSSITSDNVDEVYTRLEMYGHVYGNEVLRNSEGVGRGLTYEEVVKHIGMTTNATPLTKVKFKNRISERIREIATNRTEKAKSDFIAKKLLTEVGEN
tara:strand:+ start:2438 stop:2920 length:483 start_codon:yes stop_codon:yes gene_type:complete